MDWGEVSQKLVEIDYSFLLLACCVYILRFYLKALRWQILLNPLGAIPFKKVLPINLFGNMLSIVVPIRLGDFLRPVLLKQETLTPLSAGYSTVFTEKVADSIVTVGMIFYLFLAANSPAGFLNDPRSLIVTSLLAVGIALFILFETKNSFKIARFFLSKLPQKIKTSSQDWIGNFLTSLKLVASLKRMGVILFFTLLIWGCSALSIYSLFICTRITIPFDGIVLVMVASIIGLLIPTSPGFVGNYQYASILALSIYNIPHPVVLVFAIVHYFSGVGLEMIMGILAFPFINLSIPEIKKHTRHFIKRPNKLIGKDEQA